MKNTAGKFTNTSQSLQKSKYYKRREQGTGNREQGTGNREQGTGNREQGTDKKHSFAPV
jgi:hypothetical protein